MNIVHFITWYFTKGLDFLVSIDAQKADLTATKKAVEGDSSA